jgi:hypothetical protein
MEIYSTIRLCLFVNNSTSPLPTTRLTYSLQNPDSSKADLTSAGLTFDLSPSSHHFLYPITHFIHILTKSKFHLQPKWNKPKTKKLTRNYSPITIMHSFLGHQFQRSLFPFSHNHTFMTLNYLIQINRWYQFTYLQLSTIWYRSIIDIGCVI